MDFKIIVLDYDKVSSGSCLLYFGGIFVHIENVKHFLGSVDVYLKEEDDKVFSPSGKKKKDHSDSASYNYASARKKARLERNECPENKRQLNLVMAAIQANNLPSIIIRKRKSTTIFVDSFEKQILQM